jgi:hypothetical protein
VDFYDKLEVVLEDGTLFEPCRGHGLGMANALTTLMQIVIFYMTLEKIEIETTGIAGFFHNDDAIVGFPSEESLIDFWGEDGYILSGLGIIRQDEKSFWAENAGVFCEEYFSSRTTHLNDKESYVRREVLIALSASSICQAKAITSSIITKDDTIINQYLPEIIDFWGYEFFPNEYLYPTCVGGWVSKSIAGISLDLKDLDELPYDNLVYAAYQASKLNRILPKKKKKDRKIFSPPIQKIYPSFVPEERFRADFDFGTVFDIEKRYKRLRFDPSNYWEAWLVLMRKRRRRFWKYLRNAPPFYDFIRDLTTSDFRSFFPIRLMVEKNY